MTEAQNMLKADKMIVNPVVLFAFYGTASEIQAPEPAITK